MRDPEIMEIIMEYQKSAGSRATETVLTLDQLDQILEDSNHKDHHQIIAEHLDGAPWLAKAASEAKKRYRTSFAAYK